MIEEWKVFRDSRSDNPLNVRGAVFEISNLGRIRKNYSEIIDLSRRIMPNGYVSVFHLYVHRIVYEAFIGQIPKGMEVEHINTIRNDNRLENLRLCTHKENMNNPITKKKIKESVSGENHPMYGKSQSEASKKRNSLTHTLLWQTKEYRDKLTGENHPMYGKTGPNANKHRVYNADGTYNYIRNN